MDEQVNKRRGLEDDALLRLYQILGSKKRGVPPLVPVSRSLWYQGMKTGRFPQPAVRFGHRCVCWRSSDIRALIERGKK